MKKGFFILLALLALSTSINNTFAAIIIPSSTAKTIAPDPAKVKEAVAALKGLSGKERRDRIKEIKKEMREFKAHKKAGEEPSTNTLLLVILAILLPPLAVFLHQGEINNKFWISLLLTLIFWLPGVIYALIVILGDE